MFGKEAWKEKSRNEQTFPVDLRLPRCVGKPLHCSEASVASGVK